jgi:predicted O-methyltransferase YrrM
VKWFLQNARNRLSFAVRNPGYALQSVLRDVILADERFLAAATGAPTSKIRKFLQEPFSSESFLRHLHEGQRTFEELKLTSADIYAKKVLIQYVVARAMAPEVILETGVANGVSTAYLLLALKRNEKGTLHSIEIGDPAYLPPGRSPGWFVPEWLQARWKMHIGDSKMLLPEMLHQLGEIDLFIHDSLHTYEHMGFEFRAAYPHLRQGGVLLADDALWNPAFPEFAGEVESRTARVIRGVGVLRKNGK